MSSELKILFQIKISWAKKFGMQNACFHPSLKTTAWSLQGYNTYMNALRTQIKLFIPRCQKIRRELEYSFAKKLKIIITYFSGSYEHLLNIRTENCKESISEFYLHEFIWWNIVLSNEMRTHKGFSYCIKECKISHHTFEARDYEKYSLKNKVAIY
ncbi:unnamed protein product [Moneuplotes crassus]|uniref:Uncharacterized protein n=1 Tax=Euplotes crassus TaxID=5936 RepID=A0AAD1YBC1_EUPCR|nr:unnamed protein product [Moneuplotes crassus]